MKEGWNVYKLGDLGAFFGGVTSIKPHDYGHGTPFLPYKNVFKNSKVDVNELELMNVKPQDVQKRSAIYGDIFFTASSETPDEVAMSSVLLDDVPNLTYNGFCKRFRLNDFQTLTPEFARYLFRGKAFRESVCQVATGDIRFNISQESLSNISVCLPPLAEQKRISRLLFALDDKIELNRRINDNLEQQAQAIFKSWFVDFEPFRDGEFVESEVGMIPKGWTVVELGQVSSVIAGADKPKVFSEHPNAECNVPIYSNGISEDGLYGYTDISRIAKESITISARGTIGFVCLRQIPYVPIVRLISITPTTERLSCKYLYLWAKCQNIIGTGTTQQQLTVPDVQRMTILIPTLEIMNRFTEVIDVMYSERLKNTDANQILASLRDTLLPKLMSGELSVEDAEREV